MMGPPAGSEKTSMKVYPEGHSPPQRVSRMNKFHILVLMRELNAPLTSSFRDALRSDYQ